ncbi:unnamed protein product, partial [Mesorhabditis belari]|uniref:Uncharacterized protein n=1 Tax=Mesorhabditis belari TaxID=2138241 RepID=A0AAF3J6N2_9BILA
MVCEINRRFFLNEPQQYLLLNAWVIERWTDHMLDWDPANFDNVSEIMIPHYKLWLPDTTLYNSLTMNHAETKRLMNAQLTTTNGSGANVKLLYPTMYKFSCNLDLRRKPLYYVINLIIPTGIITLISIVGFFTSSSINDIREEKITLGITTLLSMSILILMVSDKMPSTSSFIPLIGWFYTFMIMLISCATLASSFVIYIQKQGLIGNPPEKSTMKWARRVGKIFRVEMPLIMKEAYAAKARLYQRDKEDKLRNGYARKQSVWQKILTRASSSSKLNLNQSRQSPTGSIADSLLFDTKEKMDLNAASCPDYSALMTDSPRKKIQDPLRRPPTLKISRDESDHLVIHRFL